MTQTGADIQFVVGIGASAGGLEAVAELLGALPDSTGIALVLVQQLDPSHESLLAETLAKKTALPVSVALAGGVVRPGHVYVVPPNVLLAARDGHIALTPQTGTGERPSPVDVLFMSLAATYADRAIGVVLSGGDSDGSRGVCAIKQAGGFTFAQRPELARFPNMPRHAIETGCVDLVLRPHEIADQLVRLSRRLPTRDSAGPPPPVALRTRRVLIVDDHVEVGESIAHIVRTWGHQVALVRDGPSALSIAESFQPERAIVDLSLPVMSGIELARRLREVFPPPELYMIALTGYAGPDISAACLAAGFDVHLVKPGEMARLETLLGAEHADSEAGSQ